METVPTLTELTWKHCQAMEKKLRVTHLTSSLFYKDTAGKMDDGRPTKASADANLGLKKRASFPSESKVVDMIGRLHGDIFNQEQYLLIW